MARFLKKRKDVHGAVPGSVIFLGRKKMDTSKVRVFQYNTNLHTEHDIATSADIQISLRDDMVTWINIYGLHDVQLIQQIGKQFSISSLLLEDIVNTDHRPRIVIEKDYIACIVKALIYNPDDKKIHSDQISFILGPNYILTFQERVAEYFEPVRQRIRAKAGRISNEKADYLLYSLLDTIADNSLETIEIIGEQIENTDTEIIQALPKTAQKIYQLKNEVNYLRKHVRPLKDIIFQLQKSESQLLHSVTMPYYQDLQELISQAAESIEIYHSMVTDQLHVYNTYVSNKSNDIMKFLTMFASIFIPLTFIVGIYGTNFDYLPELHYKYSYFIMWGVMVLLAVGMLLYFKKKKWL